jgi:hypothetical protein
VASSPLIDCKLARTCKLMSGCRLTSVCRLESCIFVFGGAVGCGLGGAGGCGKEWKVGEVSE